MYVHHIHIKLNMLSILERTHKMMFVVPNYVALEPHLNCKILNYPH